jgi:phenylalanyl-tRNA synthetase alpha chain
MTSIQPPQSATASPEITPEFLATVSQKLETALNTVSSSQEVEQLRVDYLGKKGQLSQLKRGLKDVPEEKRPQVGQWLNEISATMEQLVDTKLSQLKQQELNEKLLSEALDVSMPGVYRRAGRLHPLTQITNDICAIFQTMGFERLDDNLCPEVETDYYNFEALNFQADHPARDMQDTYYTTVAQNVLLRSQTSNAQIRYMETMLKGGKQPPFRIIAPGRVYRNEDVSSRKNVLFHQIEGLLVDEHVSFAELKGVLHKFVQYFFGKERPTRFRASYFPFTEPSAEVDVQCIFCSGDGCRICSHTGWLEVLGAGMVHPNVLETVGIDSEKYLGFAFGLGVERFAMLRDGIEDIRLFYQNDLRFLQPMGSSSK